MERRLALVAKGSDGPTVELTQRFGHSNTLLAIGFAPAKGTVGQLRKLTTQDGEFDPMDMPLPRPSMQQTFIGRIDPRSLVGTEEITARAGSFTARHYHYLTPYGENVDAWISDTAWPICLVKLDAEQKQNPTFPGRFSYELIATGSGAKPQITRPPVPYDLEVLKKRDDEKRIRDHRPDNAPRVGDTIVP